MKSFSYDIKEKIGTLSESEDGVNRVEVNMIAWNDSTTIKLDIRRWSGEKMLKGISLSNEEVCKLKEILNQLYE